MSTRIHTADTDWTRFTWLDGSDGRTVADFFDDEEMSDVPTPALIICDNGNDEAFVLPVTAEHLVRKLRPIVDALVAASDGDLADLFGAS